MTVLEREPATTQPERAIFVASDGRRARLLRRAALVAALLAGLWVVGLGVGMLGFGSLPGVSVVKKQIDGIAGGSDAPDSKPANRVSQPTRQSSETRNLAERSSRLPVRQQGRARTRPVASRPASRPVAQTPAPPAAQTPVNPATRTRGWARTGATAPPGQARRAVEPPPPSERGQRRGQDPTAPPPVSPGQEKKAQLPPPPPQPPKKA
jgi:hypothetical protein